MKKERSQNARILDHLMSGRTLNQLEAIELFGCIRLPARITELRQQGFGIDCKMVKNQSTGKVYGQYSLLTK
jgi:hypothetical protein